MIVPLKEATRFYYLKMRLQPSTKQRTLTCLLASSLVATVLLTTTSSRALSSPPPLASLRADSSLGRGAKISLEASDNVNLTFFCEGCGAMDETPERDEGGGDKRHQNKNVVNGDGACYRLRNILGHNVDGRKLALAPILHQEASRTISDLVHGYASREHT